MPSRRDLIASVAGIVSITAGCTGTSETAARCASRGEEDGSRHLGDIAPIQGEEQVVLGIVVSDRAVSEDMYHAVQIRDASDHLVASIPLMDNRNMSSLDPSDYPIFDPESGALYSVPLGPPPIHGEFTVTLISSNGEQIATAETRFNCYADDGAFP